MFTTNYYCLVAGLKEYSLDADTKGFDAKAIVGEILEGVDGADADAVRLLYGYYDCENIASLRAGRSAHNPLGNFTREELAEELKAPKRLPEAVARVVRAYADPEGEDAETASQLCNAVFVRSARCVCSNLAAILVLTDRGSDPEHPACICADGSVIRRSRAFREALDGFMDSFIRDGLGRYAVIWSTENATMLGSAAAALLN